MVKNPVLPDAQVTHKYDDILHMEYPLETSDKWKHPPMSVADRAKIFAPFAALRGYEEAIAAKQKIVVPRIELSEEAKEELDRQLLKVAGELAEGRRPVITVVYFQKDKQSESGEGEYIQFSGVVAKFSETSKKLQIVEKKLLLSDIYHIEIEESTL